MQEVRLHYGWVNVVLADRFSFPYFLSKRQISLYSVATIIETNRIWKSVNLCRLVRQLLNYTLSI